jgi:hypothetical protein
VAEKVLADGHHACLAVFVPSKAKERRLPRRSLGAKAGSYNEKHSPIRMLQPIFNCGKLDQCTERSLINFFRWV